MTTLRAAVAVFLLAGFFVFALGIVVGLFAVAVLVGHGAGGKLAVVAVVVAIGIGRALWQVFRNQNESAGGLLLAEAQAPELFALVRRLATEVGTRAPDEIRLIAQVNAAVSEDTRWLGLRAGIRRMYVGVPLLTAFDIDQLRSVLAHELGHYSHSHTRLAEITYQGRATIIRTAQNIGPKSVVGYLFQGYLRLYLLVSQAVNRRQELEADRASVRLAGRQAAASALREIRVLDAAWDFFLENYVAPGHGRGLFPADLFAGFAALLTHRAGELAELRASEPTRRTGRWDSHPALPDRLAAIDRLPDMPHVPDHRPAAVLVGDLPALSRAVEASAFSVGDRRVLPWAEFTATAVDAAVAEQADEVYRAAARVAGREPADLGLVLDLLEAGRAPELATALARLNWHDPDEHEAAVAVVTARVGHAVDTAVVRAGAARWHLSWSGPAFLAGPDGTPLDVADVVAAAVADPAQVPALRHRLAGLGVVASQATATRTRATADRADLVGAIAGINLDGQRHDLLILDRGLVFVPAPRRGEGEARVRRLLASLSPADLAARNRWLPFEDIAEVVVERKVPVTLRIASHRGPAVLLTLRLGADRIGESQDALFAALGPYFRRVPDPVAGGPGPAPE